MAMKKSKDKGIFFSFIPPYCGLHLPHFPEEAENPDSSLRFGQPSFKEFACERGTGAAPGSAVPDKNDDAVDFL